MAQVPDFPQSFGSKRVQIALVTGPASYTQVTTGSPPTGGQKLNASDYGLKWIDMAIPMASDDGQYELSITPATNVATAPGSVIAVWKVAHTGAEVAGSTNLSARTVRVFLIGN
jgi:hypothetical protein